MRKRKKKREKFRNKKWKEYETLVHEILSEIYQQLNSSATVTRDDYIPGFNSGIERQIDASIKFVSPEGREILIIVQAKDYGDPADVNVIGAFHAVMIDVKASKGILICSSGFTSTTATYAKNLGIDLYSAHAAHLIKWRTELKIPILKKSTRVTFELSFQYKATQEFVTATKGALTAEMIKEISKTVKFKAADHSITTIFAKLLESWEKNGIDRKRTNYSFTLEGYEAIILGATVPVSSVNLEYQLIEEFHFKFCEPAEYRGLKDHINNTFISTLLKFEDIPLGNDGTWIAVKSPRATTSNYTVLEIEYIDFTENEKYLRCGIFP